MSNNLDDRFKDSSRLKRGRRRLLIVGFAAVGLLAATTLTVGLSDRGQVSAEAGGSASIFLPFVSRASQTEPPPLPTCTPVPVATAPTYTPQPTYTPAPTYTPPPAANTPTPTSTVPPGPTHTPSRTPTASTTPTGTSTPSRPGGTMLSPAADCLIPPTPYPTSTPYPTHTPQSTFTPLPINASFQGTGDQTNGPLFLNQGALLYIVTITPSTTTTGTTQTGPYSINLKTQAGSLVNAVGGQVSGSTTFTSTLSTNAPTSDFYRIDVDMPFQETWRLTVRQPP